MQPFGRWPCRVCMPVLPATSGNFANIRDAEHLGSPLFISMVPYYVSCPVVTIGVYIGWIASEHNVSRAAEECDSAGVELWYTKMSIA